MALSSGGDEPVADGEVNSPFAVALKKRVLALPKDSNGYSLYQEVRADVTSAVKALPVEFKTDVEIDTGSATLRE